jgi:hypothetical protein
MITTTNISTTNNTTVYTSDGETGITTLLICNHHASTDAVVDVYVVPDTGTAGNANQILKSLTIVASDTFVMDMEKLVLSDGDTVVIRSDVSDVVNSVISSMAVA